MITNVMSIQKLIVLLSISWILTACNGDDNSSPNKSPKTIAVNAQDSISFSSTKALVAVDLRQRVHAQDGQALIISNVRHINGDCEISSINGLSFNIVTHDSDVCRFKYSVKPSSGRYIGDADGIAQVVINDSPSASDFLPPASKTLERSESFTFDKKALFIEDGFNLDPTSLYLIGDTKSGELGKISDANDVSFTYKAPDSSGTVRVFYTEVNATKTIVKSGVVYIAIGQHENRNPVAYDSTLDNKSILDGPQTIDVMMSDPDDDKTQLLYVHPILGTANIISDHEFEYTPILKGHDYITFVVSDHNGGYGIGMTDFTLSEYRDIYDDSQKLLFSAPFVMSDQQMSSFSGTHYESGAFGLSGTYPTFTKNLAESYCIVNGMSLPSLSQLQSMRKNVLNDKPVYSNEEYQWHSGLPFISKDSSYFSLNDGKIYDSSDNAYFTCVKNMGDHKWVFLKNSILTVLGQTTEIPIVEVFGDHKTPRPPKDVNLQLDKLLVAVDGTLVDNPDDYVKVTFNYDNLRIDKIASDVDSDSISVNATITEPKTEGSVAVNIGFGECKPGTSPAESQRISCVRIVDITSSGSLKTDKLSLPIPSNMLLMSGTDSTDLTQFVELGTDEATWAAFNYSKGSYSTRDLWRKILKPVCDQMNLYKIAGRTNWTVGEDFSDGTDFNLGVLNYDDSVDAEAWRKYIQDADDNSLEFDYKYTATINNTWKHSYSAIGYLSTGDMSQPLNRRVQSGVVDRYTFPSCYSRG
ncbi:TPA: Ig-like domain-containing protein [Photobacterium damselae]